MGKKAVLAATGMVAMALAASLAVAGDLISNEGSMLAMGCDGGDGMFGSNSQGLSCKIGGYSYTREKLLSTIQCKHGHECDDHDNAMLDVLPETWAYWQKIGHAQGTVALNGDDLLVEGQICSETECVGLTDKFYIVVRRAETATVLYRQNILEITLQEDPATGEVIVGSEDRGYFLHGTSLQQ